MRRLNILAKGNADVRDSLHALIEDGAVAWNGINACLEEHPGGWRARVAHEIMTRSDALLEMPSGVPEVLAGRTLPLGAFGPEGQYATRLFEGTQDAVVLSIQADVMHRLARHRREHHLFYPHELGRWDAADRAWLVAEFEEAGPLTPEQSMRNLAQLAGRVRQAREIPVLVYNLSPILPWERVHNYQGMSETLGERIRRFNLALIGLSRAEGISIVDVEAVVAREGAGRTKRDAVNLTAAGCRAVAAEVVRVLDDLGCLASRPVAA